MYSERSPLPTVQRVLREIPSPNRPECNLRDPLSQSCRVYSERDPLSQPCRGYSERSLLPTDRSVIPSLNLAECTQQDPLSQPCRVYSVPSPYCAECTQRDPLSQLCRGYSERCPLPTASLCSLAGRYENPICRTCPTDVGWRNWSLESIPGLLKCLQISGFVPLASWAGREEGQNRLPADQNPAIPPPPPAAKRLTYYYCAVIRSFSIIHSLL